jgi:hypothetical protein
VQKRGHATYSADCGSLAFFFRSNLIRLSQAAVVCCALRTNTSGGVAPKKQYAGFGARVSHRDLNAPGTNPLPVVFIFA